MQSDQAQCRKMIKKNQGSQMIQINQQEIQNKQTGTMQDQENNKELLFEQTFLENQRQELFKAFNTIQQYRKISAIQLRHQQKSIQTIPDQLLNVNSQIKHRVSGSMDVIKENYKFLNLGLQSFLAHYQYPQNNLKQGVPPQNVLVLLHQIVRQWAAEAHEERYFIRKVIKTIQQFAQNKEKILVDGSSLGRILLQLKYSFKGSMIQGNQTSPQYFIFSDYFLHHCTTKNQIYPYIHNFSNHIKTLGPYRSFLVPQKIPEKEQILTTFGQFTEIYESFRQKQHQWDVIVTCFTAQRVRNVFGWIQCIFGNLKQGGIWIDINTANFDSHLVPLSYFQFLKILKKSQFQIINQQSNQQHVYQNKQGLIYDKKKVFYLAMRKKGLNQN